MKTARSIISVVLAFQLLSTAALVGIAEGAAREKGTVTLKPGPVTGVVVGADGEFLSGAAISVRPRAGGAVTALASDDAGGFCLAPLPAGQYTMNVNGYWHFPFSVAVHGRHTSLNILLPAAGAYAAGAEDDEILAEDTGGLLEWLAENKELAVLGLAGIVGAGYVFYKYVVEDDSDCP